ncbi:hypothetical protein ACLIKE_00375 [Ferroplasma acidiphilum]|uniref:Uncharacterized protein n=2 Tax=Ferroplasma TaxID=74968 RepID=S0ANP4_FERAC|nr:MULTISPECIES: hypothetical protein [Ferroplasma]AGO60367.1 hypothetical protein FACI_IFERC00001G0387 [Ferroplasma acidarmanus Fer1]NOL60835.1 hypothetical protein [Ferroplasma acidiphilum]
MTNHTQTSIAATYTPGDAKYSTGFFGWTASFSPSELELLSIALGSGATVAGVIAFFTTGTIVGIRLAAIPAVAAAIMGVGSVAIGILAYECGNGGNIGTTWFGSPEFGCNPVPWGF